VERDRVQGPTIDELDVLARRVGMRALEFTD
jgi:hypothetical protein